MIVLMKVVEIMICLLFWYYDYDFSFTWLLVYKLLIMSSMAICEIWMSCLWTKLYTRLMYPFDCTKMAGVYLITVLGTALGCTYSLGGVQLGG